MPGHAAGRDMGCGEEKRRPPGAEQAHQQASEGELLCNGTRACQKGCLAHRGDAENLTKLPVHRLCPGEPSRKLAGEEHHREAGCCTCTGRLPDRPASLGAEHEERRIEPASDAYRDKHHEAVEEHRPGEDGGVGGGALHASRSAAARMASACDSSAALDHSPRKRTVSPSRSYSRKSWWGPGMRSPAK